MPGVHVLPVGFERHLLCGAANRRNEGVGLALIVHIDFARDASRYARLCQLGADEGGTIWVPLCPGGWLNLGHHVPRVVSLLNVVYEPRNGTMHPAKLAGQLAVRSRAEEADLCV